MKIGLERSKSKIYDRLVTELARGFQGLGHETAFLNPDAITSATDLLLALHGCDWVVITNSSGILSLETPDNFLFEVIPPKVAFLHHDAPFNRNDLAHIRKKLAGYQRIQSKSIHFSIEKADENDLNGLGISCYPITHINSLGDLPDPPAAPWTRDLAFIGHAMPPINGYISYETDWDRDYFACYQARIARLDHRIKADFERLHQALPAPIDDDTERFARKAQFIQHVNAYSLFQRGALLQCITQHGLHIYGGDPSWLHGRECTHFMPGANIEYHEPVFDVAAIGEIFAGTRINLNITSLQFDTGVINRVLDCAASGGFMLTDTKEQLREITSVADDIMFATPGEMLEKIEFYLDPANDGRRREITRALAEDLKRNCSLESTLSYMLEKMEQH